MFDLTVRVAPFLLILGMFLGGCTQRPTEAKLVQWRLEAIARNNDRLGQQMKEYEQKQWKLTLSGQTQKGDRQFTWSELEQLATTNIETTSPHNSSAPDALLAFRGIAISQLLDRLGVSSQVSSVTFLALDGFRSTISLTDLRRYPIMLALERNGRPISRSEGGPLSLVFPQTRYPQLREVYADRAWAFYVTHAIVGTEPIRIRVGTRVLNRKDLDQLPQISLQEAVGYRQGWPVGKVKLRGVRVKHVLEMAGVGLKNRSMVIVKGKSLSTRDQKDPIRLPVNDIRDCNVLLVTRWGNNYEPIPAQLGGPVTLAFPSSCYGNGGFQRSLNDDRHWVTFVEELEVE